MDSLQVRKMTSAAAKLPCLTIVIPCRNEEQHLGGCLNSIIESDYPHDRLQVLVLDGDSTDKTQSIIERFHNTHSFITYIANPGGNKSRAINIGIQNSEGEIIMRLDAHAYYETAYFSECVKALHGSDAASIGGVRSNLPGSQGVIAKTIAHCLSNPFAVGNALYNTGCSNPTYVDILFLFCVRRSLFDDIGLFDERYIRGQDREFNMRIQKNGGKLLLIPSAKSNYYCRSTLSSFAKWAFDGGLTPVVISRIAKRSLFSVRNFVPPAFVISLALLAAGSLFSPLLLIPLSGLLFVYFGTALAFSFRSIKSSKDLYLVSTLPPVFLLYHGLYGLGFLYGFFNKGIFKNSE